MNMDQHSKAKKIYDDCVEGKLNKYGMMVADFQVFYLVLCNLGVNGVSEFINAACVKPLERCGFTVKQKGVGWEARV